MNNTPVFCTETIVKALMISGSGQYHTAKPGVKLSKPYNTITLDDIISMVKEPVAVDKSEAQWVIPSSTGGQDARVFKYQLDNGLYHFLWADLDNVPLTVLTMPEIMASILPDTYLIIYNTKRATPENQKCRIIVPLAEPCTGQDYCLYQKILNDKIEVMGIEPDRATERPAQLCYLPNRGDFYNFHIVDGNAFSISTWSNELDEEIQKNLERDQAIKKQREQSIQRCLERISSGQLNPLQAFKECYSIKSLFQQHGYMQKGPKWLSPLSGSKTPGVITKDGKWFSHHGSDENAGIGKPAANGGTWGDAFDLFVYFEHGGNYDAAVRAAGDIFMVNGQTINKQNQIEYMRQQDQEETPSTIKPKQRFKIVSLYELRERNPKVEQLVPGFLNRGEGLLIHAPGGLGKSMLTLNMALEFASRNPEPLYNQFEIPQTITSLFIQTENSAATVNSRIRAMVDGDPKKIEALKNIVMPEMHNDVVAQGRPFTDENNRDLLIQIINGSADYLERKIDIMWIDPLISFCSGDENDSAKMRLELDALSEICRETGVTPVIVHHDNRQGEYRGASSIFDWCRSMIGLKLEFIGSNRITDIDSDGTPIKRVKPVPCIRMVHEKSNNSPKFAPFLLKMDQHLNFNVIEETVTPEQQEQGNMVVQALTNLGGTAESHNDLAKVYATLAGVGVATGKRHITTAVNNDFIIRKSVMENGSHAYKYELVK